MLRYHEVHLFFQMAPAVEHLLHTYPEYVTVDSFPMENVEEKVRIVQMVLDIFFLLLVICFLIELCTFLVG